ncbi:hypothetical protein CVS40_4908 [Lucilia cuprina]|nr:hypothetical protein CVS40_4908 [Lucilia cuprina]
MGQLAAKEDEDVEKNIESKQNSAFNERTFQSHWSTEWICRNIDNPIARINEYKWKSLVCLIQNL